MGGEWRSESVLNGAVLPLPACHDSRMSNNRGKKQPNQEVLAILKNELAKAGVAKPAQAGFRIRSTAAVKEAAKP